MNILFLTPDPPNRLNRVRAYNLLRYLSRSHNIYLLSIVKSQAELQSMEGLRAYCKRTDAVFFRKSSSYLQCLRYLPTALPLRVAYCRCRRVQTEIHRILDEVPIDLVLVKRARMAQHVESLVGVPRVLDLTDAVSLYYKRSLRTVDLLRLPLHLTEYLKMRRYEPSIIHKFDLALVCSSVDRDFLVSNSSVPVNNLEVIPNGVDTEFYRPHGRAAQEKTLLFSGLMDRHVNVDGALFFCHRILPLVRQSIPDVKLYVVGPEPTASVRRLAREPGVVVTGFVPDLREYLGRAQVVVCPIRAGAGARNKILQAMALGKPVVSTTVGFEGIDGQPGRDILIADTPALFAECVVSLIQDGEMREGIERNGQRLVQTKYAMEHIANTLDSRLARLLSATCTECAS